MAKLVNKLVRNDTTGAASYVYEKVLKTDLASGIADKNIKVDFPVGSTTWVVTHNWGVYPAIQCFNTFNEQIEGTVKHNSANQLTVTFSHNTSGYLILN